MNCPVKPECSKARYGKGVQRSEYTEYIINNKTRIEQNKELYKRRQAIVEHPYGTIKRQWGFNYILTKKSLERASADAGFMMVAYNLRRIINIVGFKELSEYFKSILTCLFPVFGVRRIKLSLLKAFNLQIGNWMNPQHPILIRLVLTQKSITFGGF